MAPRALVSVLCLFFVCAPVMGRVLRAEPKSPTDQSLRLDEHKKSYAPKYGDWMNDYDGDGYANCLVEHRCSGSYEPVCALGKTHDNECHARCAGAAKDQVQHGECGGCVEPRLCCKQQDGGISKVIDWNSGDQSKNVVCVRSEGGRKCDADQYCADRDNKAIAPEQTNSMRAPPRPVEETLAAEPEVQSVAPTTGQMNAAAAATARVNAAKARSKGVARDIAKTIAEVEGVNSALSAAAHKEAMTAEAKAEPSKVSDAERTRAAADAERVISDAESLLHHQTAAKAKQ